MWKRGGEDHRSVDTRGSAEARRRRRAALVSAHGYLHRGQLRVRCHHCGKRSFAASSSRWQVDRYPICGHDGGKYELGNVVISCGKCNGGRCAGCRR